jgi:pimeloyl-ACP methyl ester carboxylesterase
MTTEAVWKIPEPLSTCDVRLDDSTVTTVRRHGNPSGPRMVLSHGNGLAADLYYPFWSLLAGDFDLAVYDVRNHGWNSVGDQRDHNIPTLISDHDIVLDAIAERAQVFNGDCGLIGSD